jgi:hypothetical protein
MKAKTNQTALDVTLDLTGSISQYEAFLKQLPVGTRIGLDDVPELLDVDDVGQTWTPDLTDVEFNVSLDVIKSSAITKAPFNTFINILEPAINWGNDILPDLFDIETFYQPLPFIVPEELKHKIQFNQTAIDVVFDLSGRLSALQTLFEQMPTSERIGFDSLLNVWEDTDKLNQTWTPDVQNKSFLISLPVISVTAIKKRNYNTDIESLSQAISWGNDFLAESLTQGDYVVDSQLDYLTDDNDVNVTT